MPGWNSLEAVQSVHAWLEGLALIFFAGLVVFDVLVHLKPQSERKLERMGLICFATAVIMEIVAYPYGKRGDRLANLRIAWLNDRAAASEREAAQLRKLAEDEHLARLEFESRVAWRRITEHSQSVIASRLSRFSGQVAQIS